MSRISRAGVHPLVTEDRHHDSLDPPVSRPILQEQRIVPHDEAVTLVEVLAFEPIRRGPEDRPDGLREAEHHRRPERAQLQGERIPKLSAPGVEQLQGALDP
jgi:hypothetical protein